MRNTFFIFLLLLLVNQVFFSCKKDTLTDPGFELGFSTDTLKFDTVFVTLGSTTEYFTIRNRENQPVVVSSITLEGGSSSKYRINVDGTTLPTGVVTNVVIPPEDSLYVFVEVTIDPNEEILPFLIEDRIIFITNGNEQEVRLQAYGQNAHFIVGEELESQTWIDDLPYVVLNSMLVKECHTLTIREGVEVFFGGNSGMFVAGNLVVEGSADSMVTFRGLRLDDLTPEISYDEVPGQWSGIFLLRSDGCDVTSSIQFAEIRNAQFGLSLGSTSLDEFPGATIDNGPDLTLENSIIKNHSVFGIYGILSTIKGKNLLVHSAGSQLIAFQLGGNYNFEHCTFYNQGSAFLDHQDELLFFSNYFFDPVNQLLEERDLEKLDFLNCILYGTLLDEIVVDTLDDVTTAINYNLDHCLIKTRDDFTANGQELIVNIDPGFIERTEDDYHLLETSPCIDMGNIATAGNLDLDGELHDGMPDIGVYEFLP